MKTGALVLAAGKGTRMHSDTPKVLQTLLGESMLAYVLAALRPIFGKDIWVVVGHGGAAVRAACASEDVHFIEQTALLGTGHALMSALPALEQANIDRILVINGDTPQITESTVRHMVEENTATSFALATIRLEEPGAFGRIVRTDGKITGIVEAKDYDNTRHGEPTGEVNAGMYLFNMNDVQRLLPKLSNNNASNEYYITDLVALAVADGLCVTGMTCGNTAELLGVNSPSELIAAEECLRMHRIQMALEHGVLLHNPQTVCLGPFTDIEAGAEIFGPCEILGRSQLKRGCRVEAFCHVKDSVIEKGALVRTHSHLESAHVGVECTVGPFARLRPGAELATHAHVGNFVEIKNARLAEGVKANHLSYIGDADIGAATNIGAGTITCNYDGKKKSRTVIGKKAFIGSNTALVAPVTVGDAALIGAGSVITKDVPAETLAVARSKQQIIKR